MEAVEVMIIKYKSKNGKIYDNEKDALLYDDIHDGIKKICPSCNGLKKVLDEEGKYYRDCGVCNSKGYLELIWK